MRFRFIHENRQEFLVGLMCKVLAVSPNGYYAWRKRPSGAREMANERS